VFTKWDKCPSKFIHCVLNVGTFSLQYIVREILLFCEKDDVITKEFKFSLCWDMLEHYIETSPNNNNFVVFNIQFRQASS
jgi:hypothetical protein